MPYYYTCPPCGNKTYYDMRLVEPTVCATCSNDLSEVIRWIPGDTNSYYDRTFKTLIFKKVNGNKIDVCAMFKAPI